MRVPKSKPTDPRKRGEQAAYYVELAATRAKLKAEGRCYRCKRDNDRKGIRAKNGTVAGLCSVCLQSDKDSSDAARAVARKMVSVMRGALGLPDAG